MKFKDNFSKTLLVSEQPVLFYCDDPYLKQDVSFSMKIVSVQDTFTHPYIQYAIAILNLSKAEMKKSFKIDKDISTWELLQTIGLDHYSFLMRCMRFYFEYIFGNQFTTKGNKWFLKTIEIDESFFDRVKEITLVAAGITNFDDQASLQLDKPKWLIEKEAEIRRIKNQKNKQVSTSHQQFEQLMNVFLPLNYELGYSFEELFHMNYFHIQFISKYVPKIVGYDIQKRQVFSKKKIKYITEK